ncbi:MAG: tetratricopeptide repeat protein [Planctomycetes bacterium]|nr:tetratricopeptide repeat protein [Planctomycetota bacterium]
MKVFAVLLSVLPGLGHILLGRCRRGLVLFTVFAVLVNFWVVAPVLWQGGPPPVERPGLFAAAALVWLYSMLDAMRLVYWRERAGVVTRKKHLFLEALAAYVRNDLEGARRRLKRVLRLDRDDPTAHFYLGMVYQGEGKRWRARRCYKRSLALDETKKWRWEISTALEEMKAR